MAERWKPEYNEIITNMHKYQCNACGIRICSAEYQDGSGVPFKCTCITDRYCKPQWKEIEREVATLPKLTAEVFDRPDCPEWAKWATVDKDGTARFHAEEPIVPTMVGGEWWCSAGDDSFIDDKFDASDWKHSRIERPAKLPDWCKVWKWVWSDGDYYKVIETGVDWFRTSRNGDTGLWGGKYITPVFTSPSPTLQCGGNTGFAF